MGKKSKRRGGTGGGKKSRQTAGTGGVGGSLRLARDQLAAAEATGAAGPAATPADALALLETVPPPTSLKGIVSTNDDPGKCAKCLSPAALFAPIGTPGVSFSPYCLMCCGKRLCRACPPNDYAPDLLGEHRCTFCNALWSSRVSLCLQAATAGKTWAHYSMGLYYMYLAGDSPSRAFDCMVKAASQGLPEAFLMLCELCRGKWGHPRDLTAAQAFARKARSFYPDLRLISNMGLFDIATDYLEDGAVEEVMAILSDVAKQVDPDALDGKLCAGVATVGCKIEQYQLASEMSARAFCHHGNVQSALSASDYYFVMEHYCLSKLWLSVACKTKSGFHFCKAMVDGNVALVPWSFYKQRRDWIRAKLREISDSCGGCGAALEGDERKYCRGCKAFCYCSRDCQKLHWNRADCGHRAECKEAQDQARKIMEAIQSGKIDLSKKE